MTNGWPAPASQKLGANWVEVTVWGRIKMRFNHRRNDLKRGQQQPVDFVPALLMSKPRFPGRRCFPEILREAAGVGQPFEQIFDFQLPIASLVRLTQLATSQSDLEIGNRKLAMTYVV